MIRFVYQASRHPFAFKNNTRASLGFATIDLLTFKGPGLMSFGLSLFIKSPIKSALPHATPWSKAVFLGPVCSGQTAKVPATLPRGSQCKHSF